MSTGLRIVSLIPYKILPARLGGEKGIAVFNEYLAQQVKLTAIGTRNNEHELAKGYTFINSLSNSRIRYFNPLLYFTIRSLIRKQNADFFLIEHPYYGWLAWLIQITMNVKIVVHSHNMEYMRSQSIGRWWWKALRWYEAWVYRFCDKAFFISEDDRKHAIKYLNAPPTRSIAVTYGIEYKAKPEDELVCRQRVYNRHGIEEGSKMMLFNGALYHSTNYDALRVIMDEVNPLLMKKAGFTYKIIVCGKGLPDSFNELREYRDKNIIYAGFVDDISEYFKAADVFLNPILSGGGIKTKAVEALAMNCVVVSTPLGALGILPRVCGEMLKVVEAGQWEAFADVAIEAALQHRHTPDEFYFYYYWENIIARAVQHLQSS